MNDEEPTGYWEQEEFEDMVARALIAVFETNLYHKPPPKEPGTRWWLPHWKRGTMTDLERLRKVGPYFPPDDRYVMDGNTYWGDIDGYPQYASLAIARPGDALDGLSGKSYLEPFLAERVDSFPKGCVMLPGVYVAKYRVTAFYPKQDGIEAYAHYIGLKKNGRVVPEVEARVSLRNRTLPTEDLWGSFVLQYYADRRYLWNVEALEDKARAVFGVNEAQIKSLFYARDLPLTPSGRRRPILHWVSAHRRRVESGTEVDVRKHLRGIVEFEMSNTLFRITRPHHKPGVSKTG